MTSFKLQNAGHKFDDGFHISFKSSLNDETEGWLKHTDLCTIKGKDPSTQEDQNINIDGGTIVVGKKADRSTF